nr:DUF5057 domain-containing protein [Lachnospiraceae bacterium]
MNKRAKILKRAGSFLLLSAVLAGSIFGIRSLTIRGTLTTEAAGDVTEALSTLRSQYLDSGDQVFQVTELVSESNHPDTAWSADYLAAGNEEALSAYLSAALRGDELFGYFVDGQEPFPSVYDSASGSYLKWTDMLVSYTDEAARAAFAARLCKEAQFVLEEKFSGSVKPYMVEPYLEITEEAYAALSESDKTAYRVASSSDTPVQGYVSAALDDQGVNTWSGNWTVLFQQLSDGNVSLSELKTGEGKAYYIATQNTAYTYQELYALSANESTAGNLLYSKQSGAYVYYGTPVSAWESVKNLFFIDDNGDVKSILEQVIDEEAGTTYLDDISGNEDFNINDYPAPDAASGFYDVIFSHTNFNCDDQGEHLVIDTSANTFIYEMRSAAFTRGAGNYNMVTSEQFGDEIIVPGQFVYYQGGITSFDLFRSQVMLLETPQERSAFRIRVSSFTPGQMKALQPDRKQNLLSLEGTDMLVITGGRYTSENDLDSELAKMMALLVAKSDLPVTVDLNQFYGHSTAGYERIDNGAHNLMNLVDYLMLPSQSTSGLLIRSSVCNGTTVGSTFDSLYRNSHVITYLNREEHPDYSDKNLNFVNDSVWFYHSSNMNPYVSRNLTGEYFDANGQPGFGGYVAVYEDLVLENRTRAADISYGSRRLEEKVDDATVFRYIIGFRNKRTENSKVESGIRVLEIEPFYGYDGADPSRDAVNAGFLTTTRVSQWTGIPQNRISIVSMQMNEFIGKIDDLNNAYDLIYIGASTFGAGATDNKSKTYYADNGAGGYTATTRNIASPRYNDPNMKGLFYCHTGDYVEDDKIVAGLLATDYTNNVINTASGNLDNTMPTRASGNDLTTEKFNALIEYLKGAYPLVISDTLLSVSSEGQTVADAAFVDNSSYLYELINYAFAAYGSMSFSSSNLDSLAAAGRTNRNLVYFVNRAKLNLIGTDATNPSKIDTSNQFYSYRNTAGNTLANNNLVTVLNPTKDAEGNDVFTLQYAFRIENRGQVTAGQTYSVALYLDSNNDGKFSET